jgi:cellulose synthase (UDP-forming)
VSGVLPIHVLLAPTLFVIGAVYLLAPMLPLSRTWARLLVFAIIWAVIARYQYWRLFTTVLPAEGEWYELGWIWFCYAIEILAIFDALILYLAFLRRTDRSAEADRHEARLRQTPSDQWPSVDVYIPTFNESIEVLEKTITGALCLDYPNFKVWVLDDGRRTWLNDYCASKGVGYLTRPTNAHAKAGNINHAVPLTDGDYIAIFDADFIPQRQFLMRALGFFEDSKIGIVQIPHTFYNNDPLQTNLALQKSLPDDQRFFFEAIMPSRDAWDAAFCCGSNSVVRRAALDAVGGALPTGSITEDMLLTLAMLRKGYITRYLCERLAYGLAPESLNAFFVQRRRWARGATQILFLPEGPLGKNLSLMNRLLFLPTHWLSQSLMLLMTIIAPLVFLWTGLTPLVNVDTQGVLSYIVPMVLAVIGGMVVFAPRFYFPLAAQVLGTFQSFKILPTVLATLVKPFGHVFRVTPKGGSARADNYESGIFWTAATLIVLTIGGLLINTSPEYQLVRQTALLPMIAIWGAINIVVLFLVSMMSLQAPVRRTEERFIIEEPVWIVNASGPSLLGRSRDMSLTGVAIEADPDSVERIGLSKQVRIFVSQVGFLNGLVVRRSEQVVGIQLLLPESLERDLLISKLFTRGRNTAEVEVSAAAAVVAMLGSIVTLKSRSAGPPAPEARQPVTAPSLPAVTFVLPPRIRTVNLSAVADQREALVA